MSWLIPIENTYFYTLPNDLLPLLEEYVSSDIRLEIVTRVYELDFTPNPATIKDVIIQIYIFTEPYVDLKVGADEVSWINFLKGRRNRIGGECQGEFTMERLETGGLDFHTVCCPVHIALNPWNSQLLTRKIQREIKGAERKAPLPEDE